VRVVANYTDGFGMQESVVSVASANVANVNDAPTGVVTVSGTATQGQMLMASNTLADADGLGTIGYQWQSSSDGVTWTNIAGATSATISLTQSLVNRQVRVVASYTDGSGVLESVSSVGTVAVANVNDAPTVATPIGAQSAAENAVWSFTVPLNTFVDADAGDTLTFSATKSDGSALPSWLSFNSVTRTFSGTPTSTSAETNSLRVTVSDGAGATARTDFVLTIANHIVGNLSINNLNGTNSNDYMEGLGSINTLKGGNGNDIVIVNRKGSINCLYGDAGSDSLDANGSVNYLNGGEGSDNMHAIGSINYLYGAAGKDILDANGSIDYLYGGTDDDTYIIHNTNDRVIENVNEGIDLVFSYVSFTLQNNVENLTLSGTASVNGTGNLKDNAITGNSGNNTLDAGSGNDVLDGGFGNDTLKGGLGNDLYRFARGGGQDVIIDTDTTAGNIDALSLSSDVAYDQLWFRHVGNDLVVNIIGGSDTVSISNWYPGSANHIEQIRAGDGRVLRDANIDVLVQAMSTLVAPAAGQTVLPSATQAQLAPVLAANWN
jgi:serralysin